MKALLFKIHQVVPHGFVETIEWVENIHEHPGAEIGTSCPAQWRMLSCKDSR